jgi:hypothetical protein
MPASELEALLTLIELPDRRRRMAAARGAIAVRLVVGEVVLADYLAGIQIEGDGTKDFRLGAH